MSTATSDHQNRIPEPSITRFLFADTRMAPVWLILRLWLGYEWLKAALGKWTEGGWVGEGAGGAVKGFAQGAMAQTTGEHPQVTGWYASFLENVVVPNATLFSYLVILGETLVGIALVLGAFTGIAAFFGVFMNASFLFAGQIRAGLVVIGSRGLGTVGRIVLGSVSEAVIHHSHWPVLVLRGGEDSWPPERVIFGDDGSVAARAAGDLGASLCGHHSARALVLHAYPRLPEVDAEGRGFDPRIVDDELRRAERTLLERSRELESRLGSRPKVRLVVGDAAASLLEAAEEAPERTLVAVGSRDLGVIGRMRLGSVSTKVVHAAKGPVLVHPPPSPET